MRAGWRIVNYTTCLIMPFLFNGAVETANLCQTRWFVETLLTPALVIYVNQINRIPLFQGRTSWPLVVLTDVIVLVGVLLPFSPLGPYLGLGSP
jgi:Mg2+-importing ATPase